MLKENKINRNILLKLFGQKWINQRDKYFQDIIDSRNKGQLKLF